MAAFKDSRTEPRTGKDLLLQAVRQEIVVFRAVRNAPPTKADFLAHAVLGERPRPTPSYRTVQWYGVSMYDRPDPLDTFIMTQERNGRHFRRAEVRLAPGLGLDVIYNAKTGHLDVFGFPEVLLGCVEGIV